MPTSSTDFNGEVTVGASVLSESADLTPGDVVYFVIDTICHQPPAQGRGGGTRMSLRLPPQADGNWLDGHLVHGDTLGACGENNLVQRLINLVLGVFAAG